MADSNTLNARLKLAEEHARAENAHDVAAIMATLGSRPKYIVNGTILEGHEAIQAQYEDMGLGDAGGFSQVKLEVIAWHVSGEAIILEGTMGGTHSAAWQGIPATGQSFKVPVCAVFTFDEEEKIAGERIYFDSGLLLKQLGIMS